MAKVQVKNPERIPVILEQGKHSAIPCIDESKFLVPKDMTLGQFLCMIRKRIEISQEKAIFLFIGGTLFGMQTPMSVIYAQKRDKDDDHLYVIYTSESTFGS